MLISNSQIVSDQDRSSFAYRCIQCTYQVQFDLCFCFDLELRPLAGHEAVTAYARRFGQTSITMRRRWPVPWHGPLTSWRRIHGLFKKRNRRYLGCVAAMGFCLRWCRMKPPTYEHLGSGMEWCGATHSFVWVFCEKLSGTGGFGWPNTYLSGCSLDQQGNEKESLCFFFFFPKVVVASWN